MTDGRLVEVVKVVDKVGFSEAIGWVLICFDFDKEYSRRLNTKWVPISTRFEWVRNFFA
jgi:hypothetical protein